MDLVALADFNLVAAHGGFSRAARASGQPKATLSRRVAALEASLGVRLVERGARSLRLTEAGRSLRARTEGALREIAEAGADAAAGTLEPRGLLRVSAPVQIATVALGQVASRFVATHPDVQVEIVAEDRMVDAVAEGFDVVIRVNPAFDRHLVGRRIVEDEVLVVAVPTLAMPGGEDVSARAVVLGPVRGASQWRFKRDGRTRRLTPEVALGLSSLAMVRRAALAGAGVATLPRSMVAADIAAGRLACWGVVDQPSVAIWALHPSRRLVSPKVAAFMRCLAGRVPGPDPPGRLGASVTVFLVGRGRTA